jgi:hypothetical protein
MLGPRMRCTDISDHDLELYVMGKLREDGIQSHLSGCLACTLRLTACSEYVAAMKKVLEES